MRRPFCAVLFPLSASFKFSFRQALFGLDLLFAGLFFTSGTLLQPNNPSINNPPKTKSIILLSIMMTSFHNFLHTFNYEYSCFTMVSHKTVAFYFTDKLKSAGCPAVNTAEFAFCNELSHACDVIDK